MNETTDHRFFERFLTGSRSESWSSGTFAVNNDVSLRASIWFLDKCLGKIPTTVPMRYPNSLDLINTSTSIKICWGSVGARSYEELV